MDIHTRWTTLSQDGEEAEEIGFEGSARKETDL